MNKALLSSARDDWETPPEFFSALNEEFRFKVDRHPHIDGRIFLPCDHPADRPGLYDRLRRRDRVLFRNPEPAGGGHTYRGR